MNFILLLKHEHFVLGFRSHFRTEYLGSSLGLHYSFLLMYTLTLNSWSWPSTRENLFQFCTLDFTVVLPWLLQAFERMKQWLKGIFLFSFSLFLSLTVSTSLSTSFSQSISSCPSTPLSFLFSLSPSLLLSLPNAQR